MKQAHFYAYGVIGEDVTSKMAVDFLNKNVDAEDIVIHINSPGGSYEDGFAIFNLFNNSGKKITTIAEGQCASIATVILLAGSVRKIFATTQPHIHNPWVRPEGGFTADDLTDLAGDLKKAEIQLADFYANKTGSDIEVIESLMKEDKSMTADQAIELKFATEIVKPVKAFAYVAKKEIKNSNEDTMTKIADTLNAKLDQLFAFVKGDKKALDEVQAADVKTSDGQTLSIEGDVAVGSMVTLNGNPTPDATYTLEDGTVITTDADSKIATVTAPQAEAEPAPVAETNAELQALKEENESLKAQYSGLETKLNNVLAQIKSNGNPTVSGTQFRNSETKTLTKAEIKANAKKLLEERKK